MANFTLKVIDIIKETEDTITIVFKQPALKKVKYLSGQYLTIVLRINGRRYLRPYSFSSSPSVDANLSITIKRVIGGVVSNHLADTTEIGDVIEVMQPMGHFTLENNNILNKHLVLWASGSGVTPLFSILKTILNDNLCDHVTLVYGNRNYESTIFKSQIERWHEQYENKFSIWNFHSKAVVKDTNPFVIEGRILPKKVLSVMASEGDLGKTIHYICGPVGLKESVKNILIGAGVDEKNIFSEDFEIIRDPKEFEDVFTQNVKVEINSNSFYFEVTKGKSILEAGLDAMVELHYSCQTGSCLLCKATLISGKIKTIGIQKLPDELSTDECLLCCSFPLSNNIKLLINN
jgi:ring-1,2-phenylacetyl-CoA epoxidase subunit PaaE